MSPLVEFASVVDALRCAEVQAASAHSNAPSPEDAASSCAASASTAPTLEVEDPTGDGSFPGRVRHASFSRLRERTASAQRSIMGTTISSNSSFDEAASSCCCPILKILGFPISSASACYATRLLDEVLTSLPCVITLSLCRIRRSTTPRIVNSSCSGLRLAADVDRRSQDLRLRQSPQCRATSVRTKSLPSEIQWFTGGARQSVGKAITEIEPRRMLLPSPKSRLLMCYARLRLGHRPRRHKLRLRKISKDGLARICGSRRRRSWLRRSWPLRCGGGTSGPRSPRAAAPLARRGGSRSVPEDPTIMRQSALVVQQLTVSIDRNGSLRCAAHSLPIAKRRSARPTPFSRRTRSRRSRTASVTAAVMLSPVSAANSCTNRWVSGFLMFKAHRAILLPIIRTILPCLTILGQSLAEGDRRTVPNPAGAAILAREGGTDSRIPATIRRLAAILAADAAGCSRVMGRTRKARWIADLADFIGWERSWRSPMPMRSGIF